MWNPHVCMCYTCLHVSMILHGKCYGTPIFIIDLKYWFHLFIGNIMHCFHGQLEQHPGGGQQVAGPPAPPLKCQWQHSDQLSF